MKKNKKNKDQKKEKDIISEKVAEIIDAVEKEKTEEKVDEPKVLDFKKDAEDAKDELNQFKDKYIRLMAEFDNYKKRTQGEVSNIIRSANEGLILQLLEVVGNFDRALTDESSNNDAEAFRKGITLIHDKFNETLKSNGLEVFDALGEEFDPELHDAMMQMPSGDVLENNIIQEIQKGYRLKGKVIQHSKVIVSTGSENTEDDTTKKEDTDTKEVSEENVTKTEE